MTFYMTFDETYTSAILLKHIVSLNLGRESAMHCNASNALDAGFDAFGQCTTAQPENIIS